MKPLRRLMMAIEDQTDWDNINWSQTADPSKIPSPGPIMLEDMQLAIKTTRSSTQAVPF